MECKEDRDYIEGRFKSSINRNIVECKGPFQSFLLKAFTVLIETLWNVKKGFEALLLPRSSVLIETLWNVKKFGQPNYLTFQTSINRNIVECKAIHMPRSFSGALVLIETLWNVKFVILQTVIVCSLVLIETLWNVKENGMRNVRS